MGTSGSKKKNSKKVANNETENPDQKESYSFEDYLAEKQTGRLIVDGKKVKTINNEMLKLIHEND